MKMALEIIAIVLVAAGWALLVWRAKPRRDVCQPLTNEERLLHYIDRRAAWEGEQRKRKLLQRQRVERMLEQRWLDRSDARRQGAHGPTVPRSLASGAA